MPLRFHKSFRILPGVRLNINGHSMSITAGSGREHMTVNTKGRRTSSIDLPGPFSWRHTSSRRRDR
ncbi:DUF4236 domain-containing protein [Streptacidiphilus sp. N1-12]|uniref:DUF4236 domain-containing protein n=2 Tax=Streptacidiphilus alkalitolerans TaxID=3342712 RepID=A0ABV6X2Z9_9ACTN